MYFCLAATARRTSVVSEEGPHEAIPIEEQQDPASKRSSRREDREGRRFSTIQGTNVDEDKLKKREERIVRISPLE